MTSPSETLVTTATRGATAGTGATLAMSVLMLVAGKLGFHGEQPPEAIVETALDAAGLDRSERTEDALASVAHLGFGAGAGATYAVLRRVLRLPGPEVAHSTGWGLAVYTASYAGWIPKAGILPPPKRDRDDRQAMMVVAHVVYGAVLGGLLQWLRGRSPSSDS
jgi:hypothetical protein